MTPLAHFEIHCTAIDPGEPRQRWNGDPMASNEATAAMFVAVDTFAAALEAQGFHVAHAGYGVTAREG